MMPYLHLGWITLPTFGLFVSTGLICACFLMQADLRRRSLSADPYTIIGIAGLAGLVGARLYHVLENPAEFFADPLPLLFSRMGFAWFGGFLGGFVALIFLARHYRMPLLQMFDVASPAAALGYGIGRIGCLVSGDGDYGIATSLPWGMSFPNGLVPTTEHVHPTPLYECLAGLMIFYYLWRLGKRDLPHGNILARYLVLTGITRFLVEYLRLNPPTMLNLSNAQIMSLLCVAVGLTLFGHNSLTLHQRTVVHTRDGPK